MSILNEQNKETSILYDIFIGYIAIRIFEFLIKKFINFLKSFKIICIICSEPIEIGSEYYTHNHFPNNKVYKSDGFYGFHSKCKEKHDIFIKKLDSLNIDKF
ncbi:MAG: hypothetical protein AM1032_000153 [Mycoplasmataceae bacterium]|nr:MAG: hypothetical protein AM1032_000153 [Mycoplasmataceae bacterium]